MRGKSSRRIWLRKVFAITLVVLLVCSTYAFADNYGGEILDPHAPPTQNNTGLYWELDPNTGELTISGNGAMPDYSSGEGAPYHGYIGNTYVGPLATTLYVEEGVTHIGSYAFTCRWSSTHVVSNVNLRRAYIAASVESIGKNALSIANLEEVYIFGENVTFDTGAIYSGATIYGYAGTSVEQYASDNGNPFVAMCRIHTEAVVNAVEATCTEQGYSGDTVCTVCGMTISVGHQTPALGHDYCLVNAVSPTCTETGYSGDSVCSRCGDVQQMGHVIDALGHLMGPWQLLNAPGCETEGSKVRFCERCSYNEVESISPIGHKWGEPTYTWAEDYSTVTAARLCSNDASHVETETVDTTSVTVAPTTTEPGSITYTATFDNEAFETQTQVVEIPILTFEGVIRIAGKNRFLTSFKVADQLKETLGVDKFDAVILAYGADYPDALGGIYLSCVLNAPILLVNSQEANITATQDYIKANLKEGGTVYMLGGKGVVPDEAVAGLEGFETVRLGGKNRYATNLAILEEAAKFDAAPTEILVCTATGFADSLSAAAVGKPILLVGATLNADQKAYLDGLTGELTFTAVGGTGVVSEAIMAEFAEYGATDRVSGKNRYLTSVAVAEKYFENPEAGVLAYGMDFPDGLCGGAVAHAIGGPLILTADASKDAAVEYAGEAGMTDGIILGGPKLISDDTARAIFHLPEDAEIVAK